MKYSKLLTLIGALGPLLAIAGCTTLFNGKEESEAQIQQEFATYKQCVENAIAEIQSDADNKTKGVNTAVAELEERKSTIVQILGKLGGSSQSSNGATVPAVTSILGIVGIALHTDNRRKDGAIRTAKAMNRIGKKNKLHAAVGTGTGGGTTDGGGGEVRNGGGTSDSGGSKSGTDAGKTESSGKSRKGRDPVLTPMAPV